MNSNRTVVSDRLLEWPVALRVLNVAEAPAFAAERGAPADEAPPKKGPKKQAGPPTDRPTRAVILPSTSFNPDDGC